MKTEEKKRGTVRRVLTVAGVVVSVILLPILLLNLFFIVSSYLYPDDVPSLFGVTPMVVVTDSMKPYIAGGDMIIDLKCGPEEVGEGDVISFFDPTRAKKEVVITHRVEGIEETESGRFFITKGDANNATDPVHVPESLLVGRYYRTIPFIGQAVLFMRTPIGIVVTVIIPLIGVIAYDLVRRRQYEKALKEQAASAVRNE
ncbi:MAG: signal peptidase I [Lachnospiraceae bacterium]|nr:signal peptidase I [Lachnospiraceae bacterium]